MNQLNSYDNELPKLAAKKCYVIHNKNDTNYDEGIDNGTTIKFETKTIVSYQVFAIIQMSIFL